ncbi:MAG: hypothetical protein BWY54_00117 [Candidatus Dependentiae bacterium ADurb.Bin331]|nr:MAG: hypothetical protein BWY54_00117 [Candidatus Dependentiae bacterium ADurb.Bin331]
MQRTSFINKIALVTLYLIAQNGSTLATVNQPLHHKSLNLIDGLFVDKHAIRLMIHVIKDVREVQYGTRQQDSRHRIGRYVFRGEKHSIHSLIEYEMLQDLDSQLAQELSNLLEHIKFDFVILMKPFINQIQGFKHTAHEIMKEWAELHDRHESFILEWGKQKHGSEEELFHQTITSFATFNSFCTDVVSFLEDLIKSCPIGYQEYLDSIKRK